MDNLVQAMFMAFAMLALVFGLSYGIYLITNVTSVSSTLVSATDKTENYYMVHYRDSGIISRTGNGSGLKRVVGIDTIISTLYKYNKESFSVEIYDKDNHLNQLFDLTVENILAKKDETNPEYLAYQQIYGENDNSGHIDLFNAPWVVNNEFIKQRIDMYISGQKAYINGKEVNYDYNESGTKNLKALVENGVNFTEEFIKYSYDGEIISDSNGEDIESLTGSTKAHSKIIAIFIAAILLFVFPLMSVAERSDDISQLTAQSAVTKFVDDARTTGKITWTGYNSLITTLSATGNAYDVELEVKVLDENVGKKSAWTNGSVVGENVYYSIYTTQILDVMQEGGDSGVYNMKEGDIISASVKNTNTTLAQSIRSIFYSISGSGTSQVAAQHSGVVTSNAKN